MCEILIRRMATSFSELQQIIKFGEEDFPDYDVRST